jgi:hypothetical protein
MKEKKFFSLSFGFSCFFNSHTMTATAELQEWITEQESLQKTIDLAINDITQLLRHESSGDRDQYIKYKRAAKKKLKFI